MGGGGGPGPRTRLCTQVDTGAPRCRGRGLFADRVS